MNSFSFLEIIIAGTAIFIVYSFSKWILKKLQLGKDNNRKYIAIIPTILLVPIIFVATIIGAFLFIDAAESYNNHIYIAFNEYDWKDDPSKRIEMVHDLIENKTLKGKTRPEVIELLGDHYLRYDENTIIYDLEKSQWYFFNNPKVLKIHFWSGRVIKTETNHKSNKVMSPDTETIDELNITTECEAAPDEHEEVSSGIKVYIK